MCETDWILFIASICSYKSGTLQLSMVHYFRSGLMLFNSLGVVTVELFFCSSRSIDQTDFKMQIKCAYTANFIYNGTNCLRDH